MDLSILNIEFCKGVGAKRADILRKELGVKSALDMLYQFPYKYIDRSRFYFIHEIDDEDTYVQIIGHITEWHTIGLYKQLKQHGHDVRILTLAHARHSRKEEDVYYISSFGINIYPDARVTVKFRDHYINEIIEWKPDVIHSQYH